MKSFTIFFEKGTWTERSLNVKGGGVSLIDYVAASDKKPFSEIRHGDEVFVVTVQEGKLLIGGRLIADTLPISKVEAVKILGRPDLIDKKKYVIGRKDKLDNFRSSLVLNLDVVKQLQLVTSIGLKNITIKGNGGVEHMDIYSPTEITELSAKLIRDFLGLDVHGISLEEFSNEGLDEVENQLYDVMVWRQVLTRQGQPDFRKKLMKAYDESCCVTKCKVVELLEAAHIDPHSDGGDYSEDNGLLLRSDIHTLFD